MNRTMLKQVARYILIGSMGVSLAFMLYFGDRSAIWTLMIFALWIIFPFSIMLALLTKVTAPISVYTMGIVSVIMCGAVYLYIDAFVLHPDPQAGLVFIVAPLYQLIIISITIALLFIAKFFLRKT